MRSSTPSLLLAVLALATQTAAAQSVAARPNYGDVLLKEAFVPDPHSVSVTSGGNVEVEIEGCELGYVSDAPDVDLYYTTTGGSDLYIYVEGEGDTMLLINTPDGGWVCDDDSHGDLDPLVHIPSAEDGLYDIWVGSYSAGERHAATLYISELSPYVATEGAPDFTLDPTYGELALSAGFLPDPRSVSLTAGGSIDVDVGSCGYGYVANAPDVHLRWDSSGASDLYLYVNASDDTTLLINRPDGTWVCDDDALGEGNPLVVIPGASAGRYDVWVGTYGSDTASATLYVSESDPR